MDLQYKSAMAFLILLVFILPLKGNVPMTADSLDHWIEKCDTKIANHNFNDLKPLIAKMKLVDSESLREKAAAYAQLYEAELYKKSDIQKTIDLSRVARTFFEPNGYPYETTRTMVLEAIGQANQGKTETAIDTYNKALEYALDNKSFDDKLESLILKINYNIGFVWVRYGDLDQSIVYLSDAMEQAITLKDTFMWAHCLNMFGNINIRRSEFKEALKYNKEGLALAKAIGSNSTTYMEGAIGASYMELGQLDSARYYLEKVIDARRKDGNQYSLAIGLINISEIYRREENCDLSDQVNNEAYEISRSMGMAALELDALVNLCLCHVKSGRYQQAADMAEAGIVKLENAFEFSIASDLYECASEAAEKLGRYNLALQYHKQHKANADSLLNEKSEAIIENLEIKYDTEKQKTEIARLEEEAKVKTIAYRNKLLLMSTSLLAALLVAGGIYFFYRNKVNKVEKRKLEIEQKLLRSQMNPHFIFNAISSIQNFLFDKSDLKTALSYLSNFGDLMRQTLEHSREEHITLENELESLRNYLTLQQLRYQNNFSYDIEVDQEIDTSEILVPPLIAQPFVENAIEHGQIYRVQGGKVIVKFDLTDNALRLSIKDNGIGVNKSEEYKIHKSKKKSLSSIITKERLNALSESSKQKFDLVIEQIKQGGTVVTIDLPKLYIR